MHDDEILDVVDRNDNIIGQKKRSEMHKEDSNFRAINVFLLNTRGQMWIPRRAAHKMVFSFRGEKKGNSTGKIPLRFGQETEQLTIWLALPGVCPLLELMRFFFQNV